jgi:hypothetical protein
VEGAVDLPVDLEIQDTIKEDMDTIKDLAITNNMYIIITTIINLTINLPLVNQENLHLVVVLVAVVLVAVVLAAVEVLVAAEEVAAENVAERSTNSKTVDSYVF